ncbi:MAG: restriction endonuclease subunit S [Coriobacteriaceae bacterium]|nr:restriction endonuclease subunit S [Coriobacteriaceae bacterium]
MQRYGAYKDSGVEWIGEIPEGWGVIRSQYAVSLRQNGNWGDEPSDPDEGEFCLRAADFDYEHLRFKDATNYVKRCFSKEKFEQVRLFEGDLVVEKSGGGEKTPVGRALVFRGGFEACYSNFLERLRVERSRALPVFFFYWWTACYQSGLLVNYFNQTTGIQNLNTSALLSEMEIALPPLPEQQAIADYLDAKTAEIDSIVSQTERSIELLREYRKSVISEAVTKGLDPDAPMKDSGVEWIGEIPEEWNSRNLGACSLLIQTGPFGSQLHQSDYGKDGDVAVINPTDIVDGAIEIDRAHLISAEKAKELGKHLLSPGNLVIGRRGEMGRCALVESDEQALCGTGCLKVVLDGTVLPKYIAAQLISQSVKEYLELNAVGTTLKNLNTNIVASIPIVIPSLPEQQAIADYLDAKTAEIDSLIADKKRQVELLKEYRKSLISEAVTGKFKVPGLE